MKLGRARRAAAAGAAKADTAAAAAKAGVGAVATAAAEAEEDTQGAEAEDTEGAAATATTTETLLRRIETALEEHVRPDLRADGGDVVVVGLDSDNILQVRLTGACQGCSSSILTLTMRVEAVLKAHISEIRFVEAVP